ncbi:MAG TPA: FHA domain-containing protein [Anaerolineaceae bacterium]|nr:FHA domain-containing protein [Anaerolineaceae bacterium]HUM49085.1 FHA domain-containing protein [Anaerolineaceae bacterium]
MENLIVLADSGPLKGLQWPVNSELIIGREDSCEIVIPDRQISRRHARIYLSTEGVFLEDLGSKNGTYLNSQRIVGSQQLHEGDEIRIAFTQTFLFLSADATLPLTDLPEEFQQAFVLRLDEASRRVWVRGVEIEPPLSAQQFNLLAALYQKAGEVVSRDELIHTVWGEEGSWVTEQALDALVRRLRERINQLDPDYEYIVTVRGHGLRLENQPH